MQRERERRTIKMGGKKILKIASVRAAEVGHKGRAPTVRVGLIRGYAGAWNTGT